MIRKAIILTYAPVNDSERELLINTKIFKLALNHHSEEFAPNARIITDYVLKNISSKFPEKIITVRDRSKPKSDKVEYYDGEFRGATILSAIDYLAEQNYNDILIVGNNSVNNLKFRKLINDEIDKKQTKSFIYQYSCGNFNLPVKSITEFCNCRGYVS